MPKAIGIVVALLVVGFIVFAGLYFAGLIFQSGTAELRGAVSLKEITIGSGEFRRSAHEHFYDKCASIQAAEQKIKNYQEEIESGVSQERREQLNAFVLGQKNTRAELVAGYNGDAQKTYTIGQFRGSNLPYYIDPNQEETPCYVQKDLSS